MEYKKHTINFRDLLSDLSGNISNNVTFDVSGNIDIPPLTDGEYDEVMKDINAAVRIGSLIISIYIDGSGNTFAQDSLGNDINNRVVDNSEYIYPYIDENNVLHDGYLTLIFDDNSTFGNGDVNNTAFWYVIIGLDDPPVLKQYT